MKSESDTNNTTGAVAQERLVRHSCDGRCASRHECKGEINRVHVMLGSKDWGWFNYCDKARAEDKRNGYTVLFENVSCSQCGRDFGPGEHGYSHCSDHSLKGQCADCKWAQEKEDRYDQMRCCCDESPNAWGDVEASDTCSLFMPNVQVEGPADNATPQHQKRN